MKKKNIMEFVKKHSEFDTTEKKIRKDYLEINKMQWCQE